MSEFEDNNIDEIFSEIAKNEPINNVEKIVHEEKIEHIKKYLNIIQSLNHTSAHINDIIIDLVLDPDFSIDREISEIIEEIYTISEDIQDLIIEKYKGIDVEAYIDMVYDDDCDPEDGPEEDYNE